MRIVAVCGSGMGSSFIVEMNIKEVCKKIGLNAEVSHTSVESFIPQEADLVVCGEDIGSVLNFDKKIVLKNLMDKAKIESELLKVI